MDINSLLRMIRKWFWLLLLALLVGGAAGLAVDLLQPKAYQASATLFVSSPNRSDINTLLGDQQAAAALASFPQSDAVLRATLQVIGDKSLSLSQLTSMVSVQNDRSTQFVTVTVRDSDPKRAAQLASEDAKQSIFQFEGMLTDPSHTQLAQDLQYQVSQLATEIKNTQDELQNQEQQLANVENNPVADPTTQTDLVNQQTSRITQLNTTLTALRTAYSQLYGEQISYFTSLSNSQVTLLQDAQVPQSPVGLQRTLAVAIGALAGLITITGVIIFIEQTDDILRTRAKVVKATAIPLLTTVKFYQELSKRLTLRKVMSEDISVPLKDHLPALKTKDIASNRTDDLLVETIKLVPLKKQHTAVLDNHNNSNKRARYQLREEFLTLGVLLCSDPAGQVTGAGTKNGSLLVTSAETGDGKTLIAAQIALSLARLGVEVVLIDANLRNPTIHTLFELPITVGLSNLLIDEETHETHEVLQRIGEPRLEILTAGTLISSSTQLIISPKLKTIIDQLSANAYVVIDSPAILTSSEAVMMAHNSRSTLLVVNARQTTAAKLEQSLEILRLATANILGVVLNMVDKEM
ncbi:MAG: polysaccharide biosynthesis tyrosine autokinase [Ktedonobacteraceae bacterium]